MAELVWNQLISACMGITGSQDQDDYRGLYNNNSLMMLLEQRRKRTAQLCRKQNTYRPSLNQSIGVYSVAHSLLPTLFCPLSVAHSLLPSVIAARWRIAHLWQQAHTLTKERTKLKKMMYVPTGFQKNLKINRNISYV